MSKHSDQAYIQTDPFFGDEAELTCRNVAIRKARKTHDCYGLNGARDHKILPGERYRYETAHVDGSYWGQFRICLECMDRHMEGC
jgi:hypothetical protein